MKGQQTSITKTLTTGPLMLMALSGWQAVAADPAEPPIPYATIQVINEADSPAVIAEKAAKVLPRPNQRAWMRLERTFFLHFGVNTFNEVEWGTGKEEPSLLPAPTKSNDQ